MNPSASATTPFLARSIVLIPALDEASVIADTVAHWLRSGARQVFVVDNGSRDETARLARDAGAQVFLEPQRGYGAAAARGLLHLPTDATWVLFISADNSDRFKPGELPAWQAAVDAGADLVLGDRCSLPQARCQLRPAQRLGSWIFRHVVRLGWAYRFHDMGSRRLLRIDAIPRLNLRDRAFGWNVEMQVRAVEARLRIVEIPSHFHPRESGESKISGSLAGSLRAAWGILSTLANLWRTRDRKPAITHDATRRTR